MNEEVQPSSPVAVNDGAADVVEADVAASDAHHTHLVEGDFFPSEVAVVDGGDGGEEPNVEQIAAEAAAALVPTTPLSSSATAVPPPRRRVRWADDADTAAVHGLVKHVTSFYMPHSSRGFRLDTSDPASPTRPSHAAAVNPTPSVFREKVNADGGAYRFCKAQRPALRFAEWKRHPHEYGSTPFERQPCGAAGGCGASGAADALPLPPQHLPLFGALFQRSVVARVAEGQVRVRAGAPNKRGGDTLQLPFMRVDALFDQPLSIPLPP